MSGVVGDTGRDITNIRKNMRLLSSDQSHLISAASLPELLDAGTLCDILALKSRPCVSKEGDARHSQIELQVSMMEIES